MSIMDDLTSAADSAKAALTSPVSVASKAAGIDLKAAELEGAGAGIVDVYEQNSAVINAALGLPPAHAEYAGVFADLLDGSTPSLNIGGQVTSALRTKLTVVNDATEVMNKAATASASATQALACFNIDMPDVAGMITDMWDTMHGYVDKAMGFIGDSISNGIAYIQDLFSGFDTSDYELETPAWIQDNLDKLQALYDKAKGYYRALGAMKDKVIDYIQSTDLYKTVVGAIDTVVDLAKKAMAAVAGALTCGPDVMAAIGDGAKILGAYDPNMMHALDAVNSKKAAVLAEAEGGIDLNDDLAVTKLLGEKQAEIFTASKKAVFDATGVGAAADIAASAKDNLFASLDNLNAEFSF